MSLRQVFTLLGLQNVVKHSPRVCLSRTHAAAVKKRADGQYVEVLKRSSILKLKSPKSAVLTTKLDTCTLNDFRVFALFWRHF